MKNKIKLCIITMLLLINSMSFLLAEEKELEEISLMEFKQNYLSNYSIEKKIKLKGKGRDYAVAKKTGDFIGIIESDNKLNVVFWDKDGNKKWSKIYNNYYLAKCVISNNAETIVLYLGKEMYTTNIILSKNGIEQKRIRRKDRWLHPSPNGKYLYWRIGEFASSWPDGIELRNKFGEKLNLKGNPLNEKNRVGIKFINNNTLIVGHRDYSGNNIISMYEIDNQNLKEIWSKRLDFRIPFLTRDFNIRKVSYNKKYIAIYARNSTSKLYIFDYNGKIVYKKNKPYASLRFIELESIIAANWDKNFPTTLINLNEKKEDYLEFEFKRFDNFNKISNFNDIVLFNIVRVPCSKDQYRTIIWDKNKKSKSLKFVNEKIFKLNDDTLISFGYKKNPEINIISGSKK